jgi:hypothetical protein
LEGKNRKYKINVYDANLIAPITEVGIKENCNLSDLRKMRQEKM